CLRRQAGNGDDALLDRIHGSTWRRRVGAERGRRRQHIATTSAAAATLIAIGRRRFGLAAVTAGVAIGSLLDFHRERAPGGDRRPRERVELAATTIAIPPLATLAWLRGLIRARR